MTQLTNGVKYLDKYGIAPEYQTIFIGHSLGGALATISVFFYIDRNIIKNEPILINFGKPRLGND